MERRWPKSERLLGFSETFLAARDHFFLADCWGARCCPMPVLPSGFPLRPQPPGAPTLQQEVLYIALGCFQPQTGPAKSESGDSDCSHTADSHLWVQTGAGGEQWASYLFWGCSTLIKAAAPEPERALCDIPGG